MTENKTGVRLPVSPKKQMAERQARESLAAVAALWMKRITGASDRN